MIEEKSALELRKEYAEKKSGIINLLDKAISFYENDDNLEYVEVLNTLKQNLLDEEFTIVVVGEFSAGKSTLLNALMRKKLLPSFSNETTATVNFLRHSDKSKNGEKGKVVYKDGGTVVLNDASLDTVTKYVSTKGENVAQNVEQLDLYLDSEFLKDNVTLVDSPGLNGIAEGHKEITEQQILKSHACIFLFNSDHPGSKTDFEFLYDLQQKVKTIFFVLNKIDQIKENEGETPESIINTLKNSYKAKFPDLKSVPKIWPIDAYQALVARNETPMSYQNTKIVDEVDRKFLEERSRIQPFEDRLFTFLTKGEKTKSQIMVPLQRIIALIKGTRDEYADTIDMLLKKTDSAEIENKIIELEDALKNLEKQKSESRKVIENQMDIILQDLKNEVFAEMTKYAERREDDINKMNDLDELNAFTENFEQRYVSKIASLALEAQENLRVKIKKLIQDNYESISSELANKLSQGKNIQLGLAEHLITDEVVVKINIEEMEKKEAEKKMDIEKFRNEVDIAEADFIEQMQNQKKIERLEAEVQSIRSSIDIINGMHISDAVVTQSQKRIEYKNFGEEIKKKGFFKSLGGCIFGKEPEYEIVSTIDTTQRDQDIQERNAALVEERRKMAAVRSVIDGLGYADPEGAKLREIKAEARLQEARTALKEMQEEKRSKMDEAYKKAIKKCSSKLSDFFEYMQTELQKQFRRELEASKNEYVNAVLDFIETKLKLEVENNQNRIQTYKNQMASSEQERNKHIEELTTKIAELNQILSETSDLYTFVAQESIDTIEEEAV